MALEGIEIWFALVVLAALVTPVVAVALSRGSLDQKGYMIRFVPAVVLFLIVNLRVAVEYEMLLSLLLFSLALVLQFLVVRWTAMRLNDLESWRWYALAWYILPYGLILAIVISAKRHSKDFVLF